MTKIIEQFFGGVTRTEETVDLHPVKVNISGKEEILWHSGVQKAPAPTFGITAINADVHKKVGDAKFNASTLFKVTGTGAPAPTYKVASGTGVTLDAATGDITVGSAADAVGTIIEAELVGGTPDKAEVTIFVDAAAPSNKTFKVADGTTTGYAAGKVNLTVADGMKTLVATDSADAVVAGLKVALSTAGDSTKLGVALNADGKTIELTPVAAATGDVKFKLTATGYTTLEITATLA